MSVLTTGSNPVLSLRLKLNIIMINKTDEELKKISDFIKKHSKKQSLIRRLRNNYLMIKYKIEDWW